MKDKILAILDKAATIDPSILVDKSELDTTLGQDKHYLATLGLTKSVLIRLERMGIAVKARYATSNKRTLTQTGPHRVRWILVK